MDNFDKACRIAYEYYKEAWHINGLLEAKDLGEKWIFYPNNKDSFFGGNHITVSKIDTKIEEFFLPDKENFELLKKAMVVDVPKEYK